MANKFNPESFSRAKKTFKLPSRGEFYDKSVPFSNGEITLKFASALEEELLTSKELINEGKAMDEFVKALIVPETLLEHFDKLLVPDKVSLYIFSRIVTFGDIYLASVKCPKCSTQHRDYAIDLNVFKIKDPQNLENRKDVNLFETTTPTGKKVLYKLLTVGDIKQIEREIKAFQKISNTIRNKEATLKLIYSIVGVDDELKADTIRTMVETGYINTIDANHIRKKINDVSPDIDISFEFECKNKVCGHKEVLPLPMGLDFFWPSSQL